MQRTIGEISIFSQQLIGILIEVETGVVVTYPELSEVIGVDVTSTKGRGYLETARKRLCKDHNIVFDTVRSVGIKRLSDEEIAKTTGESYIKSVRSKSRKTYDKINSADYHNLSKESKINYNSTMTVLALLNHVTNKKSLKRIEDKVQQTYKEIDQKEALRLLRRSN